MKEQTPIIHSPNSSSRSIDTLHGESVYDEDAIREIEKTSEFFANEQIVFNINDNISWNIAADIVKKIVPIPRIFWVIINSVYGRSGELRDVDPITFSIIENLLQRAIYDNDLINEVTKKDNFNLREVVALLGSDVSASLCYVYSVSRKVSRNLSERIFRAIIDDALLRARLGVLLGIEVPQIGVGRALLAGFSGRAGLAIQLASGNEDEAKIALSGLATGKDIGQVCQDVYGCDSLQVAALSLVAGGVNKEIALGISSFNNGGKDLIIGSEQYKWFLIFSILENLRLNKLDSIPISYWSYFGVDSSSVDKIVKSTHKIYRSGHKFSWILRPLTEMHNNENGSSSIDK